MNDDQCAGLVMEMAPVLTRVIRHEMRNQRPVDLSLPQFRTLRVLQRHPDATVSLLASHLGLTMASASKLVDVLVKHALVARAQSEEDRRKVVLNLTERGRTTLDEVWQATQARLAELLAVLSDEECSTVVRAMQLLRDALNAGGERI